MADRYSGYGTNDVVASPGITALGVEGVTTTRGKIYDLIMGTLGTPADNALEWLIRRATALGTSTPYTAVLLDPASPVALVQAGVNHTVEPTYAAASELLRMGLNQRATFRWVAAPGGEFVVPATATAAIGVAGLHASYGGSFEVTAHWEE